VSFRKSVLNIGYCCNALGIILEAVMDLYSFAPNNAAFDKLPAGTVDRLLKPESLTN
jgi:uncharacterized surface protein with fasciclin (FAS1) repeats